MADLDKKEPRDKAAEALQAEILKLTARAETLQRDNQALRTEYINADDNEAPEIVKKNIRSRMPTAFDVIDDCLATASDGIRANLAKWIIDRGLAPDTLGGVDAATKELTELLEQLAKND